MVGVEQRCITFNFKPRNGELRPQGLIGSCAETITEGGIGNLLYHG